MKTMGIAAGTSLLLGGASPVAGHSKPSMDWVPAHSSNYSDGRRIDEDEPVVNNVRWFIVHVAEGSYDGTISYFQNPDANVSAHYVTKNDDSGATTQMVDEADTAWHAGNWPYNVYSVGIEHEGRTDVTTFTDALYRASAEAGQWAAETNNFPLRVRRFDVAPEDPRDGDGGFIGHDQVPDPNDPSQGGGISHHTDPGETWNWGRYEGYLRRFHLDKGEHTVTARDIAVLDSPGTDGDQIDTAPEETAGTVVGGPKKVDGFEWFEVAYGDGVLTGWSIADWLLAARFRSDSEVTTTTDLPVHTRPGTLYPQIDTAPSGTGGTVTAGPVDNDGYRWYELEYDDDVETGWSKGYWLE